MKDRTVFMLLVIITMFQDPVNVEVKHIRDQYWTMLRRWLARMVVEKEQRGERLDPVDSILPLLANGINILPVMVNMEAVLPPFPSLDKESLCTAQSNIKELFQLQIGEN